MVSLCTQPSLSHSGAWVALYIHLCVLVGRRPCYAERYIWLSIILYATVC